MLNFIFRKFNEKRFNELSQITRRPNASRKELEKAKIELESLFIPFLYWESVLFILGGIISFILLPTLTGLVAGIFNISPSVVMVSKIIIYILSIYFIFFGIQQIYERFRYKKRMNNNIMSVLLEYIARKLC